MTFDVLEKSTHDARPVELYSFSAGVRVWRYTSGDEAQEYLGQTYTPQPMERGRVGQWADIAKSKLDIKTPHDNPIVEAFVSSPVQGILRLDIYRRHRGDSEFITLWRGRVAGFALEGAQATITCEPNFSSLKRAGLRGVAQRQCMHALYSPACGANRAAFAEAGTVSLLTGAVIEASVFSGHADGWWVGGMLADAAGTYRMITAHSGAQVTLASVLPGLIVGDSITVYPGCNHTPEICDSKFANRLNYGGLSWMPIKNPFSGDASF